MKPVLILYATREGQTRKIAEHVGSYLEARGLEACVEDVEEFGEGFEPSRYQAVVLAASVHMGHHAREMIGFVKTHRKDLARVPTAFLSVSLAAASAEDERQCGERHLRSSAEVAKATREFLDRTGFRPTSVLPVAGALLYTQYGRFVRFVMQRIAQDSGLATDTSRDFEYTAWARIDRFIDQFLKLRPSPPALEVAAAHA